MAEFKQSMSNVGGVSGVRPIRATPEPGDYAKGFAADAAASFLKGLGKGYAKTEGEEAAGIGQSFEETEQQASLFEENVASQIEEAGGALSDAQIKDIRQRELNKMDASIRTIRHLTQTNQLSETEGEMRVNRLLRNKLSNPILSMFSEDFVNAAASFTGGSTAMATELVSAGPVEQTERLKAQARAEALKESEQAKEKLSQDTGYSREATDRLYEQQKEWEARGEHRLAMKEKGVVQLRGLVEGTDDMAPASDLLLSEFSNRMVSLKRSSDSGTVGPQELAMYKASVKEKFGRLISQIQSSQTKEDWKNSHIAALNTQRDMLLDTAEEFSTLKQTTEVRTMTENLIKLNAVEFMPAVMLFQEVGGDELALNMVHATKQFREQLASTYGVKQGWNVLLQDVAKPFVNVLKGTASDEDVEKTTSAISADPEGMGSTIIDETSKERGSEGVNELRERMQNYGQEGFLRALKTSDVFKKAQKGDEEAGIIVSAALAEEQQKIRGQLIAAGINPDNISANYGSTSLSKEAERGRAALTDPNATWQDKIAAVGMNASMGFTSKSTQMAEDEKITFDITDKDGNKSKIPAYLQSKMEQYASTIRVLDGEAKTPFSTQSKGGGLTKEEQEANPERTVTGDDPDVIDQVLGFETLDEAKSTEAWGKLSEEAKNSVIKQYEGRTGQYD